MILKTFKSELSAEGIPAENINLMALQMLGLAVLISGIIQFILGIAKAGIIAFSKSLAIEYAKKNININCVSPGFIKTEMTDKINEEFKKNLISKIPSGNLGTGEDVSNCVAFLASDMATYINGETIHVNGGMYMA